MPQLASITINDGATTPVAHVFAPVTTDGQAASLAERVGSPFAYPKMGISVRPPVNNGQGLYKVALSLNLPVTKTVEGSPMLDFEHKVKVEILLSERSTGQNRKDALALMANLLASATVKTVVENLEPLY